jgi:hypothetical protein
MMRLKQKGRIGSRILEPDFPGLFVFDESHLHHNSFAYPFPRTESSVQPCNMDCDLDSEFEFQWHGPRSIFDWAGKVLVLIIFSAATCFEYIFCGRWRECLPMPKSSPAPESAPEDVPEVKE